MFSFFFSICYKRVKQNAGEELELQKRQIISMDIETRALALHENIRYQK